MLFFLRTRRSVHGVLEWSVGVVLEAWLCPTLRLRLYGAWWGIEKGERGSPSSGPW